MILSTGLLVYLFAGDIVAQTAGNPDRNNPYSTNPRPRGEAKPTLGAVPTDIGVAVSGTRPVEEFEKRQVDQSGADDPDLRQTAIYRIGIDDVLIVNLKNAANASSYHTVLADGTIDVPLAPKPLLVAGQTTEDAAKIIADAITLYTDARVEVRVREYRSHRIQISGLVGVAGPHSLKREAVPLYVIRADIRVDPSATSVIVRRGKSGRVETFDLSALNTENLLIYPGDAIEYSANAKTSALANSGFYYIAGEVHSAGQKEFTAGITLIQAILASGGAKGNPKKASVRRKTESGLLNLAEYNLHAIKSGKREDPLLRPGDMIEIGN